MINQDKWGVVWRGVASHRSTLSRDHIVRLCKVFFPRFSFHLFFCKDPDHRNHPFLGLLHMFLNPFPGFTFGDLSSVVPGWWGEIPEILPFFAREKRSRESRHRNSIPNAPKQGAVHLHHFFGKNFCSEEILEFPWLFPLFCWSWSEWLQYFVVVVFLGRCDERSCLGNMVILYKTYISFLQKAY